jgi:hypothetical protein
MLTLKALFLAAVAAVFGSDPQWPPPPNTTPVRPTDSPDMILHCHMESGSSFGGSPDFTFQIWSKAGVLYFSDGGAEARDSQFVWARLEPNLITFDRNERKGDIGNHTHGTIDRRTGRYTFVGTLYLVGKPEPLLDGEFGHCR